METVALSYSFGTQEILKDLSLKVPTGSIYGFLGPNGAGKTTTIKILLNLLPSPEGKVFINGSCLSSNRINSLKAMGALVEQPALYSHLTGLENLVNRCILLGIPRSKAKEILNIVGLSAAAHKKASQYSLGMKQRLGIGLALIADPQILLLDEPTNGLDPNGIIEIRNLMLQLSTQHGKTILVSSHLLAEIEKTATHVGIIHHGKLQFQGPISTLQELSKPNLKIEVGDIEKAVAALSEHYQIQSTIDSTLHLPMLEKTEIAHLINLLVAQNIPIYSVQTARKDLEDLFLDLTSTNS
ncbi:MAG: ATP-binding cassette domain-containing protein [Pedobacter sp.]|nr:MAG: ATP-binding cassette domain-containing protein [Pedobacter sp.]